MRVRIKNDLSKWNATRELRKRPSNMTRKEWRAMRAEGRELVMDLYAGDVIKK